jgi:hypothetical protein
MDPIPMYECHACGQSFSSELWMRYHDSVCIPQNLPAADTVPQWTMTSLTRLSSPIAPLESLWLQLEDWLHA